MKKWKIQFYTLTWVPIRSITVSFETREEARDYAERTIKMFEDNFRITEVE